MKAKEWASAAPLDTLVRELDEERAKTKAVRKAVYRERTRLLAFLAAAVPSAICANDPQLPSWPVLYVWPSPHEVLTWHISPDDMDLLAHVPTVEDGHKFARWDGASTEVKYERLAAWAAETSAVSAALFSLASVLM